MANYVASSTPVFVVGSKLASKGGYAVDVAIIGQRSHNCGLCNVPIYKLGNKKSIRKGYTATSPVYVIDILQIKAPRVLPLEIPWKVAATT